jgi:hypothetical protein
MAAVPPTIAPVAPSPTVATAPPAAAPPPPTPPPLSTLTEKASQLAGSISSQPQFEAALNSVGGSTLPPDQKGQLWDTVQKTRIGRGLPPMTIAGPPGTPPAPVAGGQTPVSPAVTAALPASVTGQPPAPSSAAAATAGPAAPSASTGSPPPQKQVPGQAVPLAQAPPAPTEAYKAPDLLTADYKAPTYKAPSKGLEYAAAALALLFPGAPIGRAAAGFAQGLNTGAKDKYARAQETAKTQYEAERDKDATLNQGRLAQAQGNFTAAQKQDAYVASTTAIGNENQERIYNARTLARAQGTNPDTGRPFQLPAQLTKPPDPTKGYDGLAAWHNARALAYTQLGATGPAAEEAAAAKEAGTQATNAANNARALYVAAQTAQREIAMHNDTIAHEDSLHNDSEWHQDQRALLADTGRRAEYGVKASAADKSLFTTWQQYTKPQTKTVEIKDVNGNVTGIHTVPMVDDKGQPVPAAISGALAGTLTKMVNLVRSDRDPEGAAAYYSAHLDNSPGGLAGQEILQQAGQAGNLRLMAAGRMPQEHAWPKITEAPAPDPFKAAGINPNDPAVKAQITAAHDAGVTDDGTIISTLKAHGFGSQHGPAPAIAPTPGKLVLPAIARGQAPQQGLIPRGPHPWPPPLTRNPTTGQLLPPGSHLPDSP